MSTTKFTEDHEWAAPDSDTITVGITQFAQEQLGDIVYVELPEIGQTVAQGEECAVVESVKAAGDVKSPIAGEVIEINPALEASPELVNSSPEDEGWFFKVKASDPNPLEAFMGAEAYVKFVESVS